MGVRRVDRARNPWLARVRVTGHDEVSRAFASEDEARAWHAAAVLALRTGQPLPGAPAVKREAVRAPEPEPGASATGMTVEQAARETVKAMKSGIARTKRGAVYRPTSVTAYEYTLRLHVVPRIGNVPVADLTPADLVRLREELMAEHSDALAGRSIDALRVVLRRQRDRGAIAMNVADGLPPFSVGRREARFLTLDEGDRIQAAADRASANEGMLVRLMLATGMRRGEVEGLTWADVEPGRIHVRRTLRRGGSVGPTKNGKERVVPVGPDTARAIMEWRMRSGRPADDARVVKLHNRKAWDAVRAATGIHMTLHDLRHTAASWWLSAGMTIHAVADLLGHSDATLVLRLYGHAMPAETDRAGEVMDAHRRTSLKAREGL